MDVDLQVPGTSLSNSVGRDECRKEADVYIQYIHTKYIKILPCKGVGGFVIRPLAAWISMFQSNRPALRRGMLDGIHSQ